MLLLDMGLGKTISSLTAVLDLIEDYSGTKILVVAPLRVANTVWKSEAKTWTHTNHLSVAIATGSRSQRLRALLQEADVTIINREKWLVENHEWIWDILIIDESSSFKSHKSQRFKALKKIVQNLKYVIELTGTPSPNGYMDLWSQMYLIDQGRRLGRTITNYRQRFFVPEGYMGYSYKLRKGAKEEILNLIADVSLSVTADHLKLGRIDIVEYVKLPKRAREIYNELEIEFYIHMETSEIHAVSTAVLANKLLQVSNGAIYDENRNVHHIHDGKIEVLKEIIEDNPNENFFVAYNFKHDLVRLQKAFPDAVTLSRNGKELKSWNKGEIRMLLAHPASAGHGLNAQYGGSAIIWFGLNWSLELYQQFNARLWRQGQIKTVRVIHIISQNTIDEKVMDAIEGKAQSQNELLEYVKNSN